MGLSEECGFRASGTGLDTFCGYHRSCPQPVHWEAYRVRAVCAHRYNLLTVPYTPELVMCVFCKTPEPSLHNSVLSVVPNTVVQVDRIRPARVDSHDLMVILLGWRFRLRLV
jgi:hypothetical protein